MKVEHARRILRRFEQAGFEPILVGGVAVQIAGYGSTNDVDLIVAVEQFSDVVDAFEGDQEIQIIAETGGWIVNGRFYSSGDHENYVKFDVINPEKFVGGSSTGEAFFRFVRSEGSSSRAVGRVADPSVVYYTRLLVPGPHGETYLDRISRDLDEGAPREWIDEAIEIAQRFGTEPRIRERIEDLDELRRETAQ